MKKLYFIFIHISFLFILSCTHTSKPQQLDLNTIKTRYPVPEGFHRVETEKGSFQAYLQNFPLKPEGSTPFLFNGEKKEKRLSTSVLDLEIDTLNLQNSAGSIYRLWAEYLYSTSQFDKIHFILPSGFICDYTKWAQGFRIKNEGNHLSWHKDEDKEDYSYTNFQQFLLKVLEYVDLDSLSKQLYPIPKNQLTVGTVILEKGEKGHAVIVMDMIMPNDSLQLFKGCGVLLAQGGIPAQEIEIIKGYYDELGLFSQTQNPDSVNYLWSP
ncbi:MAG: DUF4846 domain-containing protein, partial [Muribaculaceae bacterium]|nr:DUF4846 domain-containing protein [Muribaculaceae bacterium]